MKSKLVHLGLQTSCFPSSPTGEVQPTFKAKDPENYFQQCSSQTPVGRNVDHSKIYLESGSGFNLDWLEERLSKSLFCDNLVDSRILKCEMEVTETSKH